MESRTAGLLFLVVCIILAILLLTGFISGVAGSLAFAICLVLLGVLSRGFRRGKNIEAEPKH